MTIWGREETFTVRSFFPFSSLFLCEIVQLMFTVFFTAEKLLDDFSKYRLGSRTAKKDVKYARQTHSHSRRFCLYMAAGLPFSAISQDLRFLIQLDKLRA